MVRNGDALGDRDAGRDTSWAGSVEKTINKEGEIRISPPTSKQSAEALRRAPIWVKYLRLTGGSPHARDVVSENPKSNANMAWGTGTMLPPQSDRTPPRLVIL